MKSLKDISSVYFLGIGGIGMSALARYFKSQGKRVSGYDKTETVLTKKLAEEGIAVHFDDNIEAIDKEAELIVYTPAIPSDHHGYNYFRKNNYNVLKRSEVLGLITQSSYNICVAGTHGKTTTSAMIAHILRHSGFGCNAFLGGIASNYDTNFWSSENNVCVAEADEYDRSFLKLFPDVAVITAMDADHLDIYGTAENLQEAFVSFASNVKPGGLLIIKTGLPTGWRFNEKQISYNMTDANAGAYAKNVQLHNGSYQFDIMVNDHEIKGISLHMGGMHNIENVVAAITASKHVGVDDDKIRDAVADFRGVKRRFEYIVKKEDLVMIDDYAHHPEELRVLITGAKELFAGKKCTVIFQPHLFSRTRDFADGFASVLDIADEVILLPVYPARELPMEGVDSGMIASKMKNRNVRVIQKSDLVKEVIKLKPQLLITAGAGDIDMLVQPIAAELN